MVFSRHGVNFAEIFYYLRFIFIINFLFISFVSFAQTHVGTASVYNKKYAGRKTYSGAVYKPEKISAAHPWLPMGTKVEVTNIKTNKSIIVTINDRMAKHTGYLVDLSSAAARRIGADLLGLTRVSVKVYVRS